MVRNALRTELAALLAAPEGYRNPALRRSLRADLWELSQKMNPQRRPTTTAQ